MGKYKYLAKNIGLLTLSNFATNLLNFFLVPLYTNVLSTSDYGTYDLISTTIGVLLPILTLNIQEAVMRYAMDRNYDRKAVLTIGVRYVALGSIIVIAGLAVNAFFNFNKLINEYWIFFFLMFFVQSLSGLTTFYIRGVDKVYELSISSAIASFVTISLNIIFLVLLKWGLIGYFLANLIGPFVQVIFLIVRGQLIKDLNLKEKYKAETKEMLSYSRPLIANSIAWWVNNAADRYVVIFFCGLAANGVYSVASKIPSILNVFQVIFNQAWSLSAVKDFDPDDKSGFFANTYAAYNCFLTVVCSAIIVMDKPLARFLYAKDFFVAWRFVPWLTIAVLFGALSGYLGGFFTAAKDSKMFAISTVAGAITNIVLNLLITPVLGPLGAAIATTVCYFEVYVIRFVQSKKYISFKIKLVRDILTYLLLVLQAIVILLVDNTGKLYGILVTIFIVICILHVKDIYNITKKFAVRARDRIMN
ncbi:MAG: polysaccharide biosynthesis C-terminal domain-containing protein [Clostridiales bacterium]|nr:polysaccharide biosynthesis C-terminal domain-containing protein [Clostridiales bacterium]